MNAEMLFQNVPLTLKYDKKVKEEYIAILVRVRVLPQSYSVLRELTSIGFESPLKNLNAKQYIEVISEFQKLFRPEQVTGELDIDTCAILYALSDYCNRKNRLAYKTPT
jgi:N-acetylmuramoyl-L-alanine amidase